MINRKSTKDIFGYFLSQVIFEAFSVLRGFILPNILGPLHYGVVSTFNIIERYSNYSNLGIHYVALYKIPSLKLKNEYESVNDMKNNIFCFTLFCGIITFFFLIILAFINYTKLTRIFFWGLLISSLLPLLISLRGVIITFLKTEKNFSLISRIIIISSLSALVLTVLFGVIFKSLGVLFAQALVLFICIIILLKSSGYKFHFELSIKKIFEMLKFSFPVAFIVEILRSFLATMDKIIIFKHLGPVFVGLYTIGLSLKGCLSLLPYSISVVLGQNLIENYSDLTNHSFNSFFNSTYLLAVIMGFFSGLFFLSIPAIISIIFPAYKIGIQTAQILVFVAFFESINGLAHHVSIVNNLKVYIFSLFILAVLGYVILNFTVINLNVLYVAISILVISAINSVIVLVISIMPNFRNLNIIFVILGIGCFSFFICFLLNNIGGSKLNEMLLPILILKLFCFSVLYFPFVLYLDSDRKIIRRFYNNLMLYLFRDNKRKSV